MPGRKKLAGRTASNSGKLERDSFHPDSLHILADFADYPIATVAGLAGTIALEDVARRERLKARHIFPEAVG
jgi:hypothetical protein